MNLVIDENVLISAATEKDPSSSEDIKNQLPYPWSFNVFKDILSCKHKMIVTAEIERRYEQKFTGIKNGRFGPIMPNVAYYYSLAQGSGKVEYENSSIIAKPIPNDSKIKQDDKPFARLAVHTSSTLVSLDGPLKSALGNVVKEPKEIVD